MSTESAISTRISREILLGLTILVLLFLILHTSSASITVDSTTLGLLVLLIFIWLLPYIGEIVLPGGMRITIKQVERAQEATSKIAPQAPIGQEPIQGVSRSGELWRRILAEDANVALAG